MRAEDDTESRGNWKTPNMNSRGVTWRQLKRGYYTLHNQAALHTGIRASCMFKEAWRFTKDKCNCTDDRISDSQ